MTSPMMVALHNAAGDELAISLHGGQVLSWRSAVAGEQLYASPDAQPGPGRAVRGGVPVCFPQFAARGPLVKHGFARTVPWKLITPPSSGAPVAQARLGLDDAAAVQPGWPHRFVLTLDVELGSGWLAMTLGVTNRGAAPLAFTAALHTYLLAGDVRLARLHGLRGCRYEDALQSNTLVDEAQAALGFDGELDRVYLNTPPALCLARPGLPDLQVAQQGFADTVVWNPGPARAAALGDMPAADWTRMLCVEAAVVGRPVSLAPQEHWQGTQRLTLAPVDDRVT